MEPGTSACLHHGTTASGSAPSTSHHQPRTVLIIVNVLPLVFKRNTTGSAWVVTWSSSSISLFYRNLVSDSGRYRPIFVGCPEVFVAREEEAAVERQLESFNCVPVFLDPQVAHRYFQGFCKGVLWPIFHNVVDVYNSAKLSLDPFTETDRSSSVWASAITEDSAHIENDTQASKAAWCDPASWNPAAQDVCWADYCSVNRTFARRVIESYHDDDMIWIHDFHFLMLPTYLLRKLRVAITAIYLHVPFPSSEIFRCLAMRTEILRAMLCADHIGFLIFEHARHFLTSCKRLLGLNYKSSSSGLLMVEYNGRTVWISCSHIEPDVRHLHSIIDRQQMAAGDAGDTEDQERLFIERIERFVYDPETKKRKFVITSVDRLEGLSAIPLKLRAFDRFLALHPSLRGAVTMIQIGISLDSRPNDYHQTLSYVKQFVSQINDRWSRSTAESDQVIYFEEKPIATCPERMLLWQISDVFLDTCIRYGLSLLPFEYLVAQKRNAEQQWSGTSNDRNNPLGVMIVSEFASYSRVLNGCLLVNPWKADDIVTAFVKAIEMNQSEKRNRFEINYTFLNQHSEERWSERLLGDMEILAEKKRQLMDSRGTVEVGFGFDYRVMQFASGFGKLDVDGVIRVSLSCSHRVFIFDFGGTLSWTTGTFDEGYEERQSEQKNSTGGVLSGAAIIQKWEGILRHADGQFRAPLSNEGRDAIKALCADHRNIVFVVSTGAKSEIEAEFGSIANLNLVADNGLLVAKACQVGSSVRTWESLCTQNELVMQWKDRVRPIMQSFATRTNGSFLAEREASLLYDYRHSDPEYGEIQALELYEQLHQILKEGEATICRGKGYLEVHQFGVNKGAAVLRILHYLEAHVGVPELALYVGDDESDEHAYKAIEEFAHKSVGSTHVFTCTVGMKPSSARTYVDSVHDVLILVQALASRPRFQPSKATPQTSDYLDCFLLLSAPIAVAPAPMRPASSEPTTDDTSSDSPLLHSTEWLALGVGVALGVSIAMSPPGRRLMRQLQHLVGGS